MRAEAHLEECGAGRLVLAEERRLASSLALKPATEVSEGLLERCRRDLAEAMRRDASPAVAEATGDPPHRRMMTGAGSPRPRLRISPAFAAGLLAAGFLGGWLAPWRPPFPADRSAAGASEEGRGADLAGQSPEEAVPGVSGLRSLTFEPGGGRVSLTYETLGRSRLQGAPADPGLRRAPLEKVSRNPNAGPRPHAPPAPPSHGQGHALPPPLLPARRQGRHTGARG